MNQWQAMANRVSMLKAEKLDLENMIHVNLHQFEKSTVKMLNHVRPLS